MILLLFFFKQDYDRDESVFQEKLEQYDFYRNSLNGIELETEIDKHWMMKNSFQVSLIFFAINSFCDSIFLVKKKKQLLEFMYLLLKEREKENEKRKEWNSQKAPDEDEKPLLKGFSILPVNSMHTVFIHFDETAMNKICEESKSSFVEVVMFENH